MSGTVPRPSKRTNDVQEGVDRGRVDSVITGQESGAGGARLTNYYRPTRRGSPRPSPHSDFDINEHLPWMIVLLLLLMLVVIVVCSVKQSSRVMKKGPMQDPSSIIEKAIQRKPPAPQTHVKEKWVYYSNGQGKQIFFSVFLKEINKRFAILAFMLVICSENLCFLDLFFRNFRDSTPFGCLPGMDNMLSCGIPSKKIPTVTICHIARLTITSWCWRNSSRNTFASSRQLATSMAEGGVDSEESQPSPQSPR